MAVIHQFHLSKPILSKPAPQRRIIGVLPVPGGRMAFEGKTVADVLRQWAAACRQGGIHAQARS